MDNYFKNCPAKMEDQGRHLSDHKSSTRRNEYIKYINNIWDHNQYRMFLQSNAKTFLDKEWSYHRNNNSCWANDCVHNYPSRFDPRYFRQEREAYDSIFNPSTNKQLKPMRKCENFKDYRLNPKQ